ncbi:hypothetical protein T265_15853, partial [Opisthorchis viverrini]
MFQSTSFAKGLERFTTAGDSSGHINSRLDNMNREILSDANLDVDMVHPRQTTTWTSDRNEPWICEWETS